LKETKESIEGKMPISSKRNGSQQTISRHQQQQSIPQDKEDDYVYYPYYSKTTSNDGYEYRQESGQYQEQPEQYDETYATNNSAPIHRT